eukprot:Colp12_sorted_trinity150504_noHs@19009
MKIKEDTVYVAYEDSDGDGFFAIRGAKGAYCVVDAGYNYLTDVPMVRTFIQKGLLCTVKESGLDNGVFEFDIDAVETNEYDCEWDGTACKPDKKLFRFVSASMGSSLPTLNFHIYGSPFTPLRIDADLDAFNGTYETWGAQVIPGDQQATVYFDDSDGDGFFAIWQGENVCVIDAGLNPESSKSNVAVHYQNGLSCHLQLQNKVSHWYYYFVFVSQTHHHDCTWDGTKCASTQDSPTDDDNMEWKKGGVVTTKTSFPTASFRLNALATGVYLDAGLRDYAQYRNYLANSDDYGGEVRVTFRDRVGQGFFAVRTSTDICVIAVSLTTDSGIKPAHKPHLVDGLACRIRSFGNPEANVYHYVISVEKTHRDDCEWDGEACTP